jgi:hypothetical protein
VKSDRKLAQVATRLLDELEQSPGDFIDPALRKEEPHQKRIKNAAIFLFLLDWH